MQTSVTISGSGYDGYKNRIDCFYWPKLFKLLYFILGVRGKCNVMLEVRMCAVGNIILYNTSMFFSLFDAFFAGQKFVI